MAPSRFPGEGRHRASRRWDLVLSWGATDRIVIIRRELASGGASDLVYDPCRLVLLVSYSSPSSPIRPIPAGLPIRPTFPIPWTYFAGLLRKFGPEKPSAPAGKGASLQARAR